MRCPTFLDFLYLSLCLWSYTYRVEPAKPTPGRRDSELGNDWHDMTCSSSASMSNFSGALLECPSTFPANPWSLFCENGDWNQPNNTPNPLDCRPAVDFSCSQRGGYLSGQGSMLSFDGVSPRWMRDNHAAIWDIQPISMKSGSLVAIRVGEWGFQWIEYLGG